MPPVDGVSAGTGGEDDQGTVAPAPLLTGNTAHPPIYVKSNSLDRKKQMAQREMQVIYLEFLVQMNSKQCCATGMFIPDPGS